MKNFLLKLKIALDRGKYWLAYLNFFMISFIAVSSMKQYSVFSFMQGRYWLSLLLVGSVIGMIILGWLDLKKLGTYQKEAEILADINPVWRKLFKNQEEILGRLDKIEKKNK